MIDWTVFDLFKIYWVWVSKYGDEKKRHRKRKITESMLNITFQTNIKSVRTIKKTRITEISSYYITFLFFKNVLVSSHHH